MLARLLIESDGPNPEYAPPDPRGRPGDDAEAIAAAEAAFEEYIAIVPHSIMVQPGTILEGSRCYVHCLPDGSGNSDKGIPGIIRAEPADEQCQRVVDAHIARMKPSQKRLYDLAVKNLKADIARAASKTK